METKKSFAIGRQSPLIADDFFALVVIYSKIG